MIIGRSQGDHKLASEEGVHQRGHAAQLAGFAHTRHANPAALAAHLSLSPRSAAGAPAAPSLGPVQRSAIGNWLDVDDTMAGDAYPDAQMLRDRLSVAAQRWPRSESLPEGVVALSRAVESYYESGENPRQRIL